MRLRASLALARPGFRLAVELEEVAPTTALFGANGSGKTTLLHALAGLVPEATGRIELAGRVLFDSARGVRVPVAQRGIGVVFQDLRLFPHLDVAANLEYGRTQVAAAARRLPPAEVVQALALGPLLTRFPADLSGGERQRLALGRALLAQPRLLLLDEPLAAQDARHRQELVPYLRLVAARLELTMLYVSHSLAEIQALTDQVLVLDQGRVVAQGEVFAALGKSPLEPLRVESRLRARVREASDGTRSLAATLGGKPVVLPARRCAAGEEVVVSLHPADVILAGQRLRGISARNQLEGKIVRISAWQGRLLVHVDLGEEAVVLAEITEDARRELGMEVGGGVVCVVKTSAFRYG